MENPAIVKDLTEAGYSSPDGVPTDWPVPQTRLDQAWRALQRESPGVGERIGQPEPFGVTREDVVDVIVSAAMRVLDNPSGVEEETEQIDDYSGRRKLANATSDLYFTAAEIRRLAPPYLGGSAGSFKYS